MNIPNDMQTKVGRIRRAFDGHARNLMNYLQSESGQRTREDAENTQIGVVYGILIGRFYMEAALMDDMIREYACQIGVDVPADHTNTLGQFLIPLEINQTSVENPPLAAYEKGSGIIRQMSDEHLRRALEYVTGLKMHGDRQPAHP